MVGKFLKSIFMLAFYAAGLSVVVGVWDYTRQAKAEGYDYSFEKYQVSVVDRYGAEAVIAFTLLDSIKDSAGIDPEGISFSGLISSVVDTVSDPGSASPKSLEADVVVDSGPIILASAGSLLAPESSVYPRARALRK
jgi:hypothetical protein